jgi:hypothetical protein
MILHELLQEQTHNKNQSTLCAKTASPIQEQKRGKAEASKKILKVTKPGHKKVRDGEE